MHHVILSDQLIGRLMEALGISPSAKVRRIILDCQVREGLVAYVELWGDTRMLDIDFSDLRGANIYFAPKQSNEER